MRQAVRKLVRRFSRGQAGSIAPLFALLVVPLTWLMGAAIDFSQAANVRSSLQVALDAAVLAGANDGTTDWTSVAQGAFQSSYKRGASATAQFSAAGSRYSGTVTTSSAGSLLTPVGYRSITMGASSTALVNAADAEASCILTLGKGQSLDTQSMTFSGSPNVAMTGCALRSNTSMKCAGHDTGASAAISAGTTTNCSNPVSAARIIPDIYKPLATNITKRCTGTSSNIRWSPGSPPPSSKMVTVYLADRTEYHVCGDLTLSGSGSLTGASPATDTIIVIENGSLLVANGAAVSASRTAIVLTGNNTVSGLVDFPNGNGQSATLTLSPPTTSTDPWAGIALYQDPALTYRVSSSWGPGANLVADGVVYMPNADLGMNGNASSAPTGCTKIVANTITIGGAIDFRQNPTACGALHVTQWSVPRSVILTN